MRGNSKKWFQFNEMSAGCRRLVVSYYIYKIFGSPPLRIIAFFVVFFTFLIADEQKQASKEYFQTLEKFTGRKFPILFSSLKQFLNYGNALVDKIISFSGKINPDDFIFTNPDDGAEISSLLNEKKGIFFLSCHIGNIEILRSLLQSKKLSKPKKVNIFMDKNYCKIFNAFLKHIAIESDTETFAPEDIDLEAGIKLSKKLDNGEIIFMAGDRIARTNPEKTEKISFLNREIELPLGAFKLALLLDAPIFLISCVKKGKKFNILTKKINLKSASKKENLQELQAQFGDFLQDCALNYPFQFFNFYNVFNID